MMTTTTTNPTTATTAKRSDSIATTTRTIKTTRTPVAFVVSFPQRQQDKQQYKQRRQQRQQRRRQSMALAHGSSVWVILLLFMLVLLLLLWVVVVVVAHWLFPSTKAIDTTAALWIVGTTTKITPTTRCVNVGRSSLVSPSLSSFSSILPWWGWCWSFSTSYSSSYSLAFAPQARRHRSWIQQPLTMWSEPTMADKDDDDHDDDDDNNNNGEDDEAVDDTLFSETSSSLPVSCTAIDQVGGGDGFGRRRATIVGVSVERSSGFWVVLQLANGGGGGGGDNCGHGSYHPLQVTNDPLDRVAATSAPALTLVQLLSQVDMAGMVFPPHRLAQLVICGLEEEEEEENKKIATEKITEKETTAASKQPSPSTIKKDLSTPGHDLVKNVQDQIHTLIGTFRRPSTSSTVNATNTKDDDDEEEEEYSYSEASTWIRSRIRLPLCTLDQVHLDLSSSCLFVPRNDNKNNEDYNDLDVVGVPTRDDDDDARSGCQLDVVVTEKDRSSSSSSSGNSNRNPDPRWTYQLDLTESTVAQVLLEDYQPIASRNFLAVALALRYKAPIVMAMQHKDNNNNHRSYSYATEEDLRQKFPCYVTVWQLQQSSHRVMQNIEQSYEYHQLQAAWNMARKKQDFAAMAKIRTKLDALDEQMAFDLQQQLPVQSESDTDQME